MNSETERHVIEEEIVETCESCISLNSPSANKIASPIETSNCHLSVKNLREGFIKTRVINLDTRLKLDEDKLKQSKESQQTIRVDTMKYSVNTNSKKSKNLFLKASSTNFNTIQTNTANCHSNKKAVLPPPISFKNKKPSPIKMISSAKSRAVGLAASCSNAKSRNNININKIKKGDFQLSFSNSHRSVLLNTISLSSNRNTIVNHQNSRLADFFKEISGSKELYICDTESLKLRKLDFGNFLPAHAASFIYETLNLIRTNSSPSIAICVNRETFVKNAHQVLNLMSYQSKLKILNWKPIGFQEDNMNFMSLTIESGSHPFATLKKETLSNSMISLISKNTQNNVILSKVLAKKLENETCQKSSALKQEKVKINQSSKVIKLHKYKYNHIPICKYDPSVKYLRDSVNLTSYLKSSSEPTHFEHNSNLNCQVNKKNEDQGATPKILSAYFQHKEGHKPRCFDTRNEALNGNTINNADPNLQEEKCNQIQTIDYKSITFDLKQRLANIDQFQSRNRLQSSKRNLTIDDTLSKSSARQLQIKLNSFSSITPNRKLNLKSSLVEKLKVSSQVNR